MSKSEPEYDVLIRHGEIFDGRGGSSYQSDIGIKGDAIAQISSLKNARGMIEVDASSLAVAPGFINMLSWGVESLIEDGNADSDIFQGVTLEMFGEGVSMGPWNDTMIAERKKGQGDIKYDITWRSLSEYLEHLVQRGVSCNVASFVGATTIRINVLGYEDRAPSPSELEQMCELTATAMKEGAFGVASALIYAPASYSKTDELIALAGVAGQYGGMYISHLRSEARALLEGVEELLEISQQAHVAAEIYHFKALGKSNWHKMDAAIKLVERARDAGQKITACMYPYVAAATGLDASMPTWVQEGGHDAWVERLRDPEIRARVAAEMLHQAEDWENMFFEAGAENMLFNGFKSDELKSLTGKTLAEVAAMRGKSAAETAMDLVVEDDSRVETVYFCMSEENVQKVLRLPWTSFCSDSDCQTPSGVFLKSSIHPRAYGSFARVIGHYVRDERVLALSEAIRKLTSLPARNLNLHRRGTLTTGNYADVVIFDREEIRYLATFQKSQQLAVGMKHVFVNGVHVIRDGVHTNARPGRVVKRHA